MKTNFDWQGFYKVFSAELRALNSLFESNKPVMARRLFPVYVFTTFEAIARLIVAQINANVLESEKGLLDNRRIQVARNSETQRVDSVSHIIFALKYASFYHGTPDFEPKKVDLWDSVTSSKEVRDRVTHPRAAADLTVTVREHTQCKYAFGWLLNCLAFAETFEQNPGISFADAYSKLKSQH